MIEWIKCIDMMPSEQEWCLVYAKLANQQVLCWDGFGNRWTDCDEQSYHRGMFTHWMPLPASPKE